MKRKFLIAWAVLSAVAYCLFFYALVANRLDWDLHLITRMTMALIIVNSIAMLVYYFQKWRAQKQQDAAGD